MVNRVNLFGGVVSHLLVLLRTEEGSRDGGLHGQVAASSVREVWVEDFDSGLADVRGDEVAVESTETAVVADLVAFVTGYGLPLLVNLLVDDCVHGLQADMEHIVDAADARAIAAFAGDCVEVDGHLFGYCDDSVGEFFVFDHRFLSS